MEFWNRRRRPGVVRGRPEEEVYSGMFPEGKTQVVKQLELDLTLTEPQLS